MIEDVIAEIEGALEEATIETRILRDMRDQSDAYAQAHDAIVRSRGALRCALVNAKHAKEVLSK